MPAHIFEPAVTAAQLGRLVGDARAAHMNMLRVWGGGRYFAGACGVGLWVAGMARLGSKPVTMLPLREFRARRVH